MTIDKISPAAACPPPVPPVPPAADKTAPKVLTFDLGSPQTSVSAFLKYGLSSFITISEPGTVTQDLYLNNGAKVPATAAKAKKKAKKKKASKKLTLIGRGTTKSAVAGTVKVTVKVSKAGRKALKGKKTVKAVLITTVKDTAGNTTRLAAKKLTLAG